MIDPVSKARMRRGLLALSLLPTAIALLKSPGVLSQTQNKVRDLSWDDLIPADWKPEKLLEGMNFALLQDGDPRANEAMAKLRELLLMVIMNELLQVIVFV
ncbi:MAG: hypothetical protein EBS62_08785 [Betaproteobacteria bacterium]|nr:hypothetical protein [Betaproteobacteria bacterium]